MREFFNRQSRWLLPTMLILFILEVITFPLVLYFTWAGTSKSPELILTYTEGKLNWNSGAVIRSDGSAELSLFDSVYQNVNADNGDKIVAPGTEEDIIVRLKNSVRGEIGYTAVLYSIRSTNKLPVEAALTGDGLTDSDIYTLPDGVDQASVIRAASGTVGGGLIQDFNIDWNWQFEIDSERDKIDTYLGDKAAGGNADDVTVGLYIVVEDGNEYVIPNAPQTGDTGVGVYIVLMCVSGFMLILLTLNKRRDNKCEE